ncbi:hypothetical protein ACP_2877 [Acidobacterium capsulatum ATCC 51196]|uniref:Uncharacterized protein n=1 Tax=Acidobacterium capsulatum (strain ATCC 51196 / DSM 11244 / BCRC 80197 / JCM 7670 / NBRC 15755 / NCIMB 13165 / 161) TaxID=240015 RepID=C1F3T8_ACIC5|nr:hypothetical protein ACP_2877 [Acidobacterium capsulatum ATCC 51196]
MMKQQYRRRTGIAASSAASGTSLRIYSGTSSSGEPAKPGQPRVCGKIEGLQST